MAYTLFIECEHDVIRAALQEQCAITQDFQLAETHSARDENSVTVFYAGKNAVVPASWPEREPEFPALYVAYGTETSEPEECHNLPVRIGDLLKNIRQKQDARARIGDKIFSIGMYAFQPGSRLLWREGETDKMRLTEKEAAMLLYLLQAEGEPVGRDALLQNVWGYHAEVTTHTLETHIYRLRQKIDSEGRYAPLLITDAAGYRLNL